MESGGPAPGFSPRGRAAVFRMMCILRRAQRRRPASKAVRRICRGRGGKFAPAAAVRGYIARRLFPKAVQLRLLVCAGRHALPQGLEPLLLRGVQHWAPARCLPAQGASRRNGGLCSRADRRPEWQPKGRRRGRCPLGFSLLAIPERERKSRQRHRRCLPCFIFIARCLLPALSPARTILQLYPQCLDRGHLNTDFHTRNGHPDYFLPHRILT